MSRFRNPLLLGVTITFLLTSLNGEPYIAFRTGYKCSQCHVNRTGGGKRTAFGFAYQKTNLPAWKKVVSGTQTSFSNFINENISVGANFRVGNKTIIGNKNTRDLAGQDAVHRVDNSIIVPEANIYLEMSLIPDRVLFYIDESFSPGAANREAFGMIHNLPLNSYVKFGQIMMPFGLRLLDDGSDGSYIRHNTGFDSYGRQEVAFELGIEPGPFSLVTAVANGLEAETPAKQITSVGSVVFRHFRLGASYSYDKGEETAQDVSGIFMGGNHGLFTWMVEKDLVRKADSEGNPISDFGKHELLGDQVMTYAALDVFIFRGMNLKLSYDRYDPMTKWKTDELDRWSFGLELFPVQFLQTSIFYRYRTAPDVDVYDTENEDQLYVELQLFL